MKRLLCGILALPLLLVAACGTAPASPTPLTAPTTAPTTALGGQPDNSAAISPTPIPPVPPVPPAPTTAPTTASLGNEPDHITVQHILIAFAGTGTSATRTQDEAKTLAYDILAQAKGGADFDQLVQQYTDDQFPGIYSMSNTGLAPLSPDEYPREGMVPVFGDVGFSLQVGEIGIADYDPVTSPFGWHIIKRLTTVVPPTPFPTLVPSTGPLPKFMVVQTAKGTFKIQLYTDEADGVQNVVRNFADRARAGYFDGKTFHRVEDWVVQGGDPLGNGTGGGDIPAQYNQKSFLRGAVGVASTGGGGPQINDSQWFVVKTDAVFLDGQYSNFGQVVEGMDVVDQLTIGDKMITVTVSDQ